MEKLIELIIHMDIHQPSREQFINGAVTLLFIVQIYQVSVVRDLRSRFENPAAQSENISAELLSQNTPVVNLSSTETQKRKEMFLDSIRYIYGEVVQVVGDSLTIAASEYPDFSKADFSNTATPPVPIKIGKNIVIKVDTKTTYSGMNSIAELKKGDVVAINTRESLITSSPLRAVSVSYYKPVPMPPGFN